MHGQIVEGIPRGQKPLSEAGNGCARLWRAATAVAPASVFAQRGEECLHAHLLPLLQRRVKEVSRLEETPFLILLNFSSNQSIAP